MGEQLRIMAIVCHPADALDHAGGTLCLHAERGDEVTVVVCTHGVETHDLVRNESLSRGDDNTVELEQAIVGKEQEIVRGLGVLGVKDARFLRFPDDVVSVTHELVEAIAGQLAEVQPHLLIIHNPTEELGFGHTDSAQAVLKAVGLANTPRFLQKKKDGAFPVQIFFLAMYGHTNQLTSDGMRHGNVLVDITPVMDRKVQAMDCLKSQFYTGDLARKCVEITNGRMGLHASIPYAESFQTLHPHIYSHLPANECLMSRSRTPRSEQAKGMKVKVNEVPVLE